MTKTGVLAENWNVFVRYIEENRLDRMDYQYINSHLDLRGRTGEIIALGMWWRNPAYRNESFVRYLEDLIICSRITVKHRIAPKERLWKTLTRADAWIYVSASSEEEALEKIATGDYERVEYDHPDDPEPWCKAVFSADVV